MTTNRQNQHPAAIDAEKPTNLKTKTKRAAALLLMLLMLAPLAARAQHRDCNGPITITVDAPYTQDFESPQGTAWNEAGPLPDCWEGYSNGGVVPHNTTRFYHSGAQSLSLFKSPSADASYAILPEFSNPLHQLQISFYVRSARGSYDIPLLGYITADDDGTCNTFTPIASFRMWDEWYQYTQELHTVPATAARLVFISNVGSTEYPYIDDVEVSIAPGLDCYSLGTLSLGEVSANSAYLSWDLIDAEQTAWDVQVATDATFTENVTNLVATTHENYLLTGLNAASYYYVRVKPQCDDDLWSNTISFGTLCDGPITITADAPYTEGFESPWGNNSVLESGCLPVCWDGYSTTSAVPHNFTGGFHSGTQSLSLGNSSWGDYYAVLPEFSNAIGELQVGFWMKTQNPYGGTGQLQLGYLTAEDDGTCNTFAEIATYDNPSSGTMEQRVTYLLYVPATATRLAFKWHGEGRWCFIDDVEVSICTLDCFPVGTISVNSSSANSAYLTWNLIDNSQTAWDVQVATNAAFTENLVEYVAASHENYLVEGLNSATYYYVRVKPACSDDLWSNVISFWASVPCDGPITITADTPYIEGFESPTGTNYWESGLLPSCWEAYSTGTVAPHNTLNYAHSGSQCLTFRPPGNHYAILPEFGNPLDELQINFWISIVDLDQSMQLGYLTAEDDGTCNTFTAIATYTNTTSSWTSHTAYLELLDVPATAQRLAFKWNGGYCYFDDVDVSICTLDCFPVGALSVDNLSSTSAYLSWDLIDNSQTAWDVQVATDAAFTDTIAEYVADSHENYLLSGLSGITHYYVRVKPTCSDDLWSAIDFETPCGTFTVTANAPYTQGFESPGGTLWTQHGLLPPCWEGYNNSSYPTPHNTIGSYGAPHIVHTGEQCLSFHNNSDCYAILPEFSNPISDLQINFWMATNGNTTDKLRLGYITTEDDGTCNTFTEIASYDSNFGSMVQRSKTLENVPAEAYRLAFKWSTSYYYLCFVDDVEVSINPALIEPHDIAATNITRHEADITWEGACDSYALRHRDVSLAPEPLISEGFEGGIMPQGWTIEGDNQDPTKTWRVGVGDNNSETGTHSGNYNARITHNTNNQVTYLVMPYLNLGQYVRAELSFWYFNRKWMESIDELAVCYRIGNGGEWHELWSTAENHESWTSQTVVLAGLADNYQIGFRFTDHYGHGVALDDIAVGIAENAAWTIVDNAQSPHTLSGLTKETPYQVQVKSNCAGYEDWSETVGFTTMGCEIPANVAATDITPTSAAVSWTGFNDNYNLSYRRVPNTAPETILNEGFEGGTMPQGWTIEGDNLDPSSTWRVGQGDVSTYTGTHSGDYNALITRNRNGQVTYLVMPALALGEYGSMELSFWYINRESLYMADQIAVCYRIGNEGEWHELWSTTANHQVWTSQTIALTGLADNYQIGFRVGDRNAYGVGLDDIVLCDLTPFQWITLSEAESPQTIAGLRPETEYEVKVQGVCEGEATEWSESAYFTTLEGSIFTKDIIAHTDNGGWYLIASPVAETVTPTAENGFLANEYDLYRFNQSAELEWENWKAEGEHYHFNLEAGRGYLYANSGDVTLTFVGTPHAATEPAEVPLAYDPAADFAGWNLVGNPLPEIAFIDRDFYVMNGDRDEIVAAEGNTVELMEGIFVIAEGENDTMTFTPASQSAIANNASLVVNLSQGRCSVIDRAIVRFDSNRTLPKFQLNPNNTKVYIPQGGKDYAVVAAEQTGEMPLNFKAEKNDTYTLRFDTKDVEFDYLHLIDNLTSADVDLLAVEPVETPTSGNGPSTSSGTVASYTFTAKTTDYESRFKLVFSADEEVCEPNAPFAYISNGNIIINGAGTLQIIDILGKELERKELSTLNSQLTTSNFVPGVYVLRLVDSDMVRTQKIVVEF